MQVPLPVDALSPNAELRLFADLSQYEGFGFLLREAMGSGVPMIVAAGICFEETAGPAAGIQHASHYNWQRCIAGTVDAYQNLLEG